MERRYDTFLVLGMGDQSTSGKAYSRCVCSLGKSRASACRGSEASFQADSMCEIHIELRLPIPVCSLLLEVLDRLDRDSEGTHPSVSDIVALHFA